MAPRTNAMTSPFGTPERRMYEALGTNDVAHLYRGGVYQGQPQRGFGGVLKKLGIGLGAAAIGGIGYATRNKWKPLLNKFKKPVSDQVNVTDIYAL